MTEDWEQIIYSYLNERNERTVRGSEIIVRGRKRKRTVRGRSKKQDVGREG